MSILSRPARALVAILVAGLAIGFHAAPVSAAGSHGSKAKTAAASKAKAKAKTKTKKKITKVKPAPKADLTIKALHVDVSEDGTVLVNANLLNTGRGFAAPSEVAIALSDDNTLSDDDELLDSVAFERIGAGTTRSLDAEVDVPFDVDTSEDLRVLVCADGGGVITEKSETNNCVSQTITLGELAPVEDDSADGPDGTQSSASDDDVSDDE